MSENRGTLQQYLANPSFPLASRYDPRWIIEHQMGLNSILLTEWLTQAMKLSPGMRVLDLGCGKGLSSIFLAREFGVQVWACDLWVPATENFRRIQHSGLAREVFPIHVDARDYRSPKISLTPSCVSIHTSTSGRMIYTWITSVDS